MSMSREDEERARKARGMRYKRPLCRDLNLDAMQSFIADAEEAAYEVAWATEDADILIDAFNGDTEEAYEFRMAFADLSSDIERFGADLRDVALEAFDDFFPGIGGDGGIMIGYDNYEGDYYGLDPGYETQMAIKEAGKRLERLTKKEIIDCAGTCFRLAIAYVGLRSRYEDLQAALDILRAKNDGLLAAIQDINALYDKAARDGFYMSDASNAAFDKMIDALPDECWIR